MRTSSEAKKAAALAKAAPDIRADQMEEINAAFDHYIFRIRRTGEVWTSCCRHHEYISREQGEAFAVVLDAPHHCGEREYATHYRYCHCGMISAPPPKEPDLVKCPFCGRMAKVKELGRCGKRKNLHQWTRGVILRQYRGSLWAIAYDAAKDYKGPDAVLTKLPELYITKVYRFRAGMAERAGRWFANYSWQSYELLNKMPVKLPIPFHEPFNNSAEYGMSYDVIGAEELKKSAFRFCRVEEYIKNGHASDLMRVLALCTQRPRHVEMLTRAGMTGAVTDVAGGVRWNAAAINWKSSDPVEALGLDKEERKDFLNTGRSLKVLGAYKRMRRKGIPAEMTTLEIMRIKVSDIWFDRLISAVCACGLKLEKTEAYLNREIKAGKLKRFGEAVELWVDYISAAKVLGYDLSNPVFATPKGLKVKHDRATEAAIHVRRLKGNSERAKKEGARQAAQSDGGAGGAGWADDGRRSVSIAAPPGLEPPAPEKQVKGDRGAPAKPKGFVGRGRAAERPSFRRQPEVRGAELARTKRHFRKGGERAGDQRGQCERDRARKRCERSVVKCHCVNTAGRRLSGSQRRGDMRRWTWSR